MVMFPQRETHICEVIPSFILAHQRWDSLTQVSALLVPVGALFENVKTAGLSHLIEHMVFRGTRSFREAQDIMMAAEGMGGRINAFTTYDYIVFLVQMPATHWKLSLKLLFELAFYPLFREEDLNTEKEVVLREMAMIEDDPSEKAAVLFQKAMWGEHRLGYDVIGFPDVVKNVERDDLVAFWKEAFFSYPVYFTTLGSVPYEEIRAFIRNFDFPTEFGSQKRSPWGYVRRAEFAGSEIIKREKTNQTYYRVGLEIYPYRTAGWQEKKYHISLISAMLGGTSFSNLVQEIRDRRGWAYSVGATVSGSVAGSSLGWYMDILPGVLKEVENILFTEFDTLSRGDGIDDTFEKARTYVVGSTMMSSDSMHSTALAHLMNVAFNGDLWDPERDVKRLMALKPSDIVEEFRRLTEGKDFAKVVYGEMAQD